MNIKCLFGVLGFGIVLLFSAIVSAANYTNTSCLTPDECKAIKSYSIKTINLLNAVLEIKKKNLTDSETKILPLANEAENLLLKIHDLHWKKNSKDYFQGSGRVRKALEEKKLDEIIDCDDILFYIDFVHSSYYWYKLTGIKKLCYYYSQKSISDLITALDRLVELI